MKFPLKCPFAVIALLAIFSALSEQASADTHTVGSPFDLCPQKKSLCKKVKKGKVKLCTWENGTCKPNCKAFKKAACSKLSHCEYKTKMKECARKEETNGSCQKDLKAAEETIAVFREVEAECNMAYEMAKYELRDVEAEYKGVMKELEMARAALKDCEPDDPSFLPPAGPGYFWGRCGTIMSRYIHGIDCRQTSSEMEKAGGVIISSQKIFNSCWCKGRI